MSTPDEAAGLESREHHLGRWYRGTREALIAAGLATVDQFPGEPGCGKTSTVFPARGATAKLRVARISRLLCEVTVYWTPEERAAYEAKVEKESAERRERIEAERRRASAQVTGDLTRECLQLYGEQAPRKMAEAALKGAAVSIFHAFNMNNSPEHPWRFPEDTHEKVKRLYWDLQELFEHGGFRPALGGPVVQGDAGFQRFMASAQGHLQHARGSRRGKGRPAPPGG